MAIDDKQNVTVSRYVLRSTPALDESFRYFIQDELQFIESSLRTLVDACPQVTDKAPDGPRKGMVRYAISPWDPLGTGFSGLVVYNGSAWVAV